jgi:hypothetical protein
MTDTSLASSLFQQLQGAGLQQVAQQLNIDSGQAQNAVGAALPLLLGALGKNTQQPDGAQALLGALQRDHAGGGLDLGGLLGSVLGGGSGSAQTNGSGILGHIFGSQSSQAAASLGQATGLGGEKASQLLQVLAPIVMSFLAQRFLGSNSNADASQLGQALGQEHQQLQSSANPLASLLDQDGDGQLGLGDVLKLGAGLFGGRS